LKKAAEDTFQESSLE